MDRNLRAMQIVIIVVESLSARRAWIEIIDDLEPSSTRKLSLSARRAWIEMQCSDWLACFSSRVALRKESVDRNTVLKKYLVILGRVALRKESVDRNTMRRDFKALGLVALRKESVDRNPVGVGCLTMIGGRSPQGERG